MANVVRGTTSGTAISAAVELVQMITSFRLVNMTGGGVTVNVSMMNDGKEYSIIALNHPLANGESYIDSNALLVLSGDQIKIVASGEIDFYFTLENVSV